MKSNVSSQCGNEALRRRSTLPWLVLASASLAFASTSCKKPDPPAEPMVAAQTAPKPVDHLGPGELVESDVKAFGVVLPRSFTITNRLTTQVSGEILAQPESVANYFRARVGDGKITMGTTSTSFSHVRPRTEPSRIVDIRVEKSRNGTRVEVLEVTPPPEGPAPSQAEVLKKVGLSPSGRPDPQMQ